MRIDIRLHGSTAADRECLMECTVYASSQQDIEQQVEKCAQEGPWFVLSKSSPTPWNWRRPGNRKSASRRTGPSSPRRRRQSTGPIAASACASPSRNCSWATPIAEAIACAIVAHPNNDGRFTRIIPMEKVNCIPRPSATRETPQCDKEKGHALH